MSDYSAGKGSGEPTNNIPRVGSAALADDTTLPEDGNPDYVVDATNVLAVFEALPNTGGKTENKFHKNYLASLVSQMAHHITEPFNMYIKEQTNENNYGVMSNGDIYLNTLAEGAPITSSMLARNISMSPEEIMAHELNHLVFIEGLQKDSAERRYLERLMEAAREQLDWTAMVSNPSVLSPEEVEGAQAAFDHLFYERKGNALAEFAAFATTNENFMKAMENVKVKKSKVFEGSVGDIVRNITTNVMEAISGRVLKLKGLNPDQAVMKLLNGMMRVNAKKRHSIFKKAEEVSAAIRAAMHMPVDFLGGKITEMLSSERLRNSDNNIIAGAASIMYTRRDAAYAKNFRDMLRFVRNKMLGNRMTFTRKLFDEIVGLTQDNASVRKLQRLSNVQHDRARKQAIEATTKYVKDAFSRDLTEDEWKAMHNVALKLDLASLNGLTEQEFRDVISDETKLQAKIDELTAQLSGSQYGNFYTRAARSLGYYMNTGKTWESIGLLNAHNIAKVAGMNGAKVSRAEIEQYAPIIDQLASLYGIQEANLPELQTFSNLVNTEMTGVQHFLGTHKALKEEAATTQFADKYEAESLMIKGWTKENYREGVDMVVSFKNDTELMAQGYIPGEKLAVDPDDPVKADRYLYVAPDGMLSPYMAQIASLL